MQRRALLIAAAGCGALAGRVASARPMRVGMLVWQDSGFYHGVMLRGLVEGLRGEGFEPGRIVGRVLEGANPAETPVEQPARFQRVLNLKTASALGLAVPAALRLLADELIE